MEVVRRNPRNASAFAIHILKERWIEAEADIFNNVGKIEYAEHFFLLILV